MNKKALTLLLSVISLGFAIKAPLRADCEVRGEWPCKWLESVVDCTGNSDEGCRCVVVYCDGTSIKDGN